MYPDEPFKAGEMLNANTPKNTKKKPNKANDKNKDNNNKDSKEEKKNENVQSFAQGNQKETRICFWCGSPNCKDLDKCPDKGKPYEEWAAVKALNTGKNFAQTSSSNESVADNSTVTSVPKSTTSKQAWVNVQSIQLAEVSEIGMSSP